MAKRCCASTCYNSIGVNKTVTYFTFPRNLEFCHKWAIAAGRQDLLDKDLSKIIKYYLCSDHFEDKCFVDPSTRNKLIKQKRPVVVPIPTIFKCNFNQVIPKGLVQHKESENSDTIESVDNDEEGHEVIVLVPPSLQEKHFGEDRSLVEYRAGESYIIGQEVEQVLTLESKLLVCRLCMQQCNSEMNSSDVTPMVDIFENESIVRALQLTGLSELILMDDGRPQHICLTCLDKLEAAANIIADFRQVQEFLQ